ncbi:MAG: PAS domain-containing protein [Acidobacteria bacterium]|nr:PAS domain-containing protein [Acidobacteriota bacterium]
MQLSDVRKLAESTSDPAFATDRSGLIVAWNQAAETLFGIPEKQAVSKFCGRIVQGSDECGRVCSANCAVRQSIEARRAVGNLDLKVPTRHGKRWCNVSVLISRDGGRGPAYSIHILRPMDVAMRLELLVRQFVASRLRLPARHARALIGSDRMAARSANLSRRERSVLRLLAQGVSTAKIAAQLHISPATVNNHIQHTLRKLDVHSRLQAIRRAERAGLL